MASHLIVPRVERPSLGLQQSHELINSWLITQYNDTFDAIRVFGDDYTDHQDSFIWSGPNEPNEKGYRPLISWKQNIIREGGVGPNRIKSIMDAVTRRRNTITGQWFSSNQQDLSFYGSGDYLYNMLFGYALCSLKTYASVAENLHDRELQNRAVWDQGGSIFGAVALIRRGIDHVIVSNLPGPQVEFGKWISDLLGLENHITFETSGAVPTSEFTVIMSEYLEHFKRPFEEFQRITANSPRLVYECSAFNQPGYGHYMPLEMHGAKVWTNDLAEILFRYDVQTIKYLASVTPGWKRRLRTYEFEQSYRPSPKNAIWDYIDRSILVNNENSENERALNRVAII